VLAPVCGSGSFLYVDLRKLMGLEKEVIGNATKAGLSQMFAEGSRTNFDHIFHDGDSIRGRFQTCVMSSCITNAIRAILPSPSRIASNSMQ
jgi:hypothetical protein